MMCRRICKHLSLLLQDAFFLLCGIDVSYDTSHETWSSPDNFLSDKSFFMLYNHLPFGLPPVLFPGTPITLLPTYSSSSLLNTCMPIPLQPTFLHFLGYFSHLRCPSNSFIPNSVQLGDSTNPSILISATSNFFSHCDFFTAHVPASYIIAGLTTVLYILSPLFFGHTEPPMPALEPGSPS